MYLKFCGAIQLYLCTGQDIHAQCLHENTCLYARSSSVSRFQRFVESAERTSGNEIAYLNVVENMTDGCLCFNRLLLDGRFRYYLT
jgi:hypothetical protein